MFYAVWGGDGYSQYRLGRSSLDWITDQSTAVFLPRTLHACIPFIRYPSCPPTGRFFKPFHPGRNSPLLRADNSAFTIKAERYTVQLLSLWKQTHYPASEFIQADEAIHRSSRVLEKQRYTIHNPSLWRHTSPLL